MEKRRDLGKGGHDAHRTQEGQLLPAGEKYEAEFKNTQEEMV